jgi:radical SAM protein with 4Fe4S-binding SPASM domain
MEFLSCPEVEIADWVVELRAPLQGRRYPLSGTLELTERCNLTCVHCYINQPSANRAAQARELTTIQAKGILDQIADAGCLTLLLTGGEPLIRTDFPEIYQHAKQRGMLITFFTNGTLITPRIADLLADMRPFTIEISLYGATQETYESVTQVTGSYARCRKGIDLLLDRGLPLRLKSVVLTTNRHELNEMSDLADQLGVKFRYDGMLWPRLNGEQQPFNYQISAQEMIALDQIIPEKQEAWQQLARSGSGQPVRAEYVYNCGAGLWGFHIDCAGKLSICTMSRSPTFDLLQMSFQEAWEALGSLRNEKRQLETVCQTCKVGVLCFQCPGWSQAVHGDNETPVDFVCELGHLRAAQIQYT